METIKTAHTEEEQKLLEQNSVCTYCHSRNTHFLIHFSSVCRVDAKGQLIIFNGEVKHIKVKTGRTCNFALSRIMGKGLFCCNSATLVCENCNRQRKIDLLD